MTSKEKPLVSISSITYNHAPYIKQCMDGFLLQKTSFPLEILIHDDASTDGTSEIVKEYAEKNPDLIIPIFQKENQYSKGIAPFTNFVIPRARGKYIAFCEGDDYWTDPLKLQKQVEFLEGNEEYVACFHNTLVVNEKGVKLEMQQKNDFAPYIGDFYTALQGSFGKGATLSVLYKAEAVNINEFASLSENSKIGDWPLFLLLSLKGKAYTFPEIMGVYRNHSGGVTKNINNLHFFQTRIMIMHRIEPFINDPDKLAYLKVFQYRVYLSKFEWLIRSGNWHLAWNVCKELQKARHEAKKYSDKKFPLEWIDLFNENKIRRKLPISWILGLKNLITKKYFIPVDPLQKKQK